MMTEGDLESIYMDITMTKADSWRNLYSEGWNSEIVPAAFSHPAKFSRALIRRIYKHAVENGWLKPGDVCIDPFGGVGLGALDAMRQGLNWVGVELEARFVELGNKNIELWNERYGKHFPGWGSAKLVQGDSRELMGVIASVDGCISSPPYAESIYKPPDDFIVIDIDRRPERKGTKTEIRHTRYKDRQRGGDYGSTPGNLGNMKPGEVDGVVSSPPFGGQEQHTGGLPQSLLFRADGTPRGTNGMPTGEGYGVTDGQLGQDTGTTFWEAARVIVDQTYAALKPGGVAIWVTKAFVKNKQRVDFPGQWRRMCEAAGFVTVCEHKAWLVEDKGAQYDLFGELVEKTVERKSFFRRLAEKKGSPRIDWETVTCQVKPGATGGGVDGVVSSPPYANQQIAKNSSGIDIEKQWQTYRKSGGGMSLEAFKEQQERHSHEYSDDPRNLGNMRAGEVDAVISSPPFMESLQSQDVEFENKRQAARGRDITGYGHIGSLSTYGSHPGNLGNMKGGDYDS